MNVKSDFVYGTIEKEVYVCQPPGFEDPQFPDKVYKVEKALEGLHQAPKACTPTETNKALIKDEEAENVDVHLYRSMIGSLMYLKASRPDIMFVVCACARDSPFDLEAFSDNDYAGASLDRKSTTGGCQFLGKRLISWQCKKQAIVANSTTEGEYVVDANCCGQVLWIQNQMLDYGFNFMNTKIYIDNESTICIVKNPMFHSKIKHIEIRHHFIIDSYEKKLIQVIKIHTDHNVADLLTKAFDVSRTSSEPQTETPPTVSHEPQTEANIEHILPSPFVYQRKHRKTQKHRRAKKVTELPQTSVPLDLGADEAVHKEGVTGMDTCGSPRRQETIRGALAQTRFERVLKNPNKPPLPEGHTSGSGEGSMEHTIELMYTVPPTPYDSPLTGGYTPRSDEGRMKLKELMDMCTKLSKHLLDLEKEKDAQAVEILKLKQRVKKLKRKRKSSISHPRRRIYRQVESSDDDLDEEDASKQGRTSDKTKPMFKDSDFDDLDDLVDEGMAFVQEKDAKNQGVSTAAPRTPPTTTTVFDDEDVTMAMAQTLIKMKEEKAKAKGVAIKDVEDSSRPIRSITTLQPLPTIDPKDKGKGVLVEEEPEKPEKVKRRDQGLAQIESDAELAQRLHEEELAEERRKTKRLHEEELAELDRAQKEKQKQEEATNAALAEEFDEIQARIDADHELVVRLTYEQQEKYTIEERATLLSEYFERRKKQLAAERAEAIRNKPPTRAQVRNRMITYLKHMGKYTHQQLRHKTLEELQKLYQKEQKWINDFQPMDIEEDGSNTKKAGKRIKRIADSTKAAADYEQEKEELRIWLAVFPDKDKTVDLELLSVKYPIVDWESQNLGSVDMEDIHGDLKVMFEPNDEDEVWSNQQDWTLISWKLYKNCRVYSLLMDGTLTCFNMLVEKRYPLIKEMLKKMLKWKLEAEVESTIAFELLKFIKS
ncbi:putative ribonuclease H-like domain-containing protein [Tanacetum coccineum]